jgi:cob(I)alamin adenosyltransferase
MSYRLTKIYTRQGDAGYTSLGDKRIAKDDLLVEAVGTLDELNSFLGLLISTHIPRPDITACLVRIQNELFDLGGELHIPEHIVITPEKITYLETQLDTWNAILPPLKEFILPGGNTASATCHLARTVCRRAERCMVRLNRQLALSNPDILRYLNRLSDLLFVCARVLAREEQAEEKMWEHER